MKKFITFIRTESPEFRGNLVVISVLAGIVNGFAVALAINAAKDLEPGKLQIREFLLFAIALVAYWVSKEYVLNRTTAIVEGIIRDIRMRIMRSIRTTSLTVFEKMNRGRIYSVLSTDAITLSLSSGAIINASSSACMLAFVIASIGFLSVYALGITVVFITSAVYLYILKSRTVNAELASASRLENDFFENLNGLLYGYKELKLSRAKNTDFFSADLWNVITSTAALRTKTGKTMNQSVLIGQTFLLFTVAGILFLLPNLKPDDVSIIVPVIAIVLFAAGPIGDVVVAIPALARAGTAIDNIYALERDLKENQNETEIFAETQPLVEEPFESIECRGMSFSYPPTPGNGHEAFAIQPFDFHVKAGEIVFIVGGNGSGKSTFLKLLTALYEPAAGSLVWNGRPVTADRLASYRNLFTPIFTDFHIFKRILGVPDLDENKVRELIARMDLVGKTDVKDRRLTHTDLSTGQKKRLALILAKLDNRPIYIFDEWAADQDPTFRRFFYTQLLPEIKAQGHTVIAVTHDDSYFAHADRVLKMGYGRFLEGEHHTQAFAE
ncbi:MAG TPA: cyclic peptide export ABC transporter [Opitutus sp.]|nr:cyclic peptide export ABC transporter [Opitutus sp.]